MNIIFTNKYPFATFLQGIILLVFVGFGIAVNSSSAPTDIVKKNTQTWVEKLRRDIFTNYEKSIRPAKDNETIDIKLHLEIIHIKLEETNGIFTLYGHLHTEWKDSKLVWDKDQYGQLDLLPVADHEIWLPDLMNYNSALKDSVDYYGNSQCYVKSNGEVSWTPYIKFKVYCNLDPRLWPFDSHQCAVVLGSWTFSEWHIDLKLKEAKGFVQNTIIKNGEWSITNVEASRHSIVYSCCEAPYVSIRYNITIQRRSDLYKTVIYFPTVCIIFITLACFWLPPQMGEKILLNGVNLLIVLMFLKYFAEKLPSLALSTPAIVQFYCNTLVFIGLATVISVIVLSISKVKHTRPLPVKIRRLLKGCLGKFLGVAHLNSKVGDDSELTEPRVNVSKEMETSSITEEFYQKDWILFAIAIDRLAFVIYCFIFALLPIFVYY